MELLEEMESYIEKEEKEYIKDQKENALRAFSYLIQNKQEDFLEEAAFIIDRAMEIGEIKGRALFRSVTGFPLIDVSYLTLEEKEKMYKEINNKYSEVEKGNFKKYFKPGSIRKVDRLRMITSGEAILEEKVVSKEEEEKIYQAYHNIALISLGYMLEVKKDAYLAFLKELSIIHRNPNTNFKRMIPFLSKETIQKNTKEEEQDKVYEWCRKWYEEDKKSAIKFHLYDGDIDMIKNYGYLLAGEEKESAKEQCLAHYRIKFNDLKERQEVNKIKEIKEHVAYIKNW